MVLEKAAKADDLVLGICFLDHLLGRWGIFEIGECTKELLDFARRLVDVDDSSRLIAREGPDMRDVARQKDRLARAGVKSPIANLKYPLAVDDVNPLILVVVDVTRPSACELERAHRAVRILCRSLAIQRLASELDLFIEAVASCRDIETGKYFLILHPLCSFKVLDCLVDGFKQSAYPREILLQNRAMRP